jgi:2,3-bisphosphoglycerate-independent phosphoglycerate mutase
MPNTTKLSLKKHPRLERPKGPVLLVVLDGIGLGPGDAYDAVAQAKMPNLKGLIADSKRSLQLKAHGTAVGLPSDDDMGNSEVGHNALGSGRIVKQGASLVDDALASGAIFEGAGFQKLEAAFKAGGTFHIIGLLSDGGVHSRLDQILGVLDGAAARGAARIRMHVLLDGRDVPDGSALQYVDELNKHLDGLKARFGVDARIASGGGRMVTTMDRYESDWSIVERGWKAHVLGDARRFPSAHAAIEAFRAGKPGISDQNLPAFVVEENGQPVGPIVDGDAVLFANFRGDRAIEISRAFDDEVFKPFDRVRHPKVTYAGMMEYDGDLHIPKTYLVSPPVIEETSGEYLTNMGIRTFACSETQKYGHVTYFWNGNRSGRFDDALETYVEVPSNMPPFEAKPEMKAPEIADATIAAIESGKHDLLRVNFANGDMVGHTGNLEATILGCEAVDVALGRLLDAVKKKSGIAIVTADHGNADDMALRDKKNAPLKDAQGKVQARTSHTFAPVPFVITGPGLAPSVHLRKDLVTPGLANVAATVMNLLGYEAPAGYEPSLLEIG